MTVYVPSPTATDPVVAGIADGSGIVGKMLEDGNVLVYYEGDMHGATGLDRFANRVRVAWGRASEDDPTRAKAVVPAGAVVPVGEYDAREQVVRLTGAEGARLLAEWLGGAAVTAEDLIARS